MLRPLRFFLERAQVSSGDGDPTDQGGEEDERDHLEGDDEPAQQGQPEDLGRGCLAQVRYLGGSESIERCPAEEQEGGTGEKSRPELVGTSRARRLSRSALG